MKRLSLLVAAGMLLHGLPAMAGTYGSMYPNVDKGTINQEVYSTYREQGTSRTLPKLLVFSSVGECVGVSDGTLQPASMVKFIKDSLSRHQKACAMVMSNNFGVTKVGPDSGTGKSEVRLFIGPAETCASCDDFRIALLRASHSALADMHLNITTVEPAKGN